LTASSPNENVDVGSLVQADATSGTFMFIIMQSDVIRIQVHVPQDQAFGLAQGSTRSCACLKFPTGRFPVR
jgi:hypothetical protein